MKKKIVSLSIFAVAIILLTGVIPALASPPKNMLAMNNTLVTIEVSYYLGRQPKQLYNTVSAVGAEEIRHNLIELYNARERNDRQAIATYVALLQDKGILGKEYRYFSSKTNGITKLGKATCTGCYPSLADENISNRICYFNAIGEGAVLWGFALSFWEAIIKTVQNQSNPLGAFIILLILLPLGVMVMLLSNLIPFRILAPAGTLALKNGTISALGLNGPQRVKVGVEGYGVNLSGFTGLTINIPSINNRSSFLFVSGIALKAEGQNI